MIIPENRLHLVMDFNDSTTQTQLKGLFNTVVVDELTLKFCEGNRFIWLRDLLQPLPDAQLITEMLQDNVLSTPYSSKKKNCIPKGLFIYRRDWTREQIRDARKEFVQATRDYLLGLFDTVEEHDQEKYPTRSGLSDNLNMDFFIMNGPLSR